MQSRLRFQLTTHRKIFNLAIGRQFLIYKNSIMNDFPKQITDQYNELPNIFAVNFLTYKELLSNVDNLQSYSEIEVFDKRTGNKLCNLVLENGFIIERINFNSKINYFINFDKAGSQKIAVPLIADLLNDDNGDKAAEIAYICIEDLSFCLKY